MIKFRDFNRKVLAYVMAFVMTLVSLPSTLAEGEIEITNGDAIETTIPGEKQDEIGFSEISEIEKKSFDEFEKNISEWYEGKEDIVDIYAWEEDYRNQILNALEFIANPANYFDVASTLLSEGIIMPNESGNGILDSNCNTAFSFFMYLLDESVKDNKFDVGSICCTEQNRDSYRRIVEPVRDLFSKKKLDITELQQVYYSLARIKTSIKNRMESLIVQGEEPRVAVMSVINEVIYCHLANVELFFKLDEVAGKYRGEDVAKYLNIPDPKKSSDVIEAIFSCDKKEGIVFNLDSDDSLEVILGIMEKTKDSFTEFFRPYVSIYDDALMEKLENFQNVV